MTERVSHTSLVGLGEEGGSGRGLALRPHGAGPGHQVLGLHHLLMLLATADGELIRIGLGVEPIAGNTMEGWVL